MEEAERRATHPYHHYNTHTKANIADMQQEMAIKLLFQSSLEILATVYMKAQ